MADTTILIVEDESIVAMDLQSRLTAMGYAVAGVAASGADALAKITAARPDLILMDIKLKGDVDGVQVAD
jgi:CheY-like chemotaxis protein